MNQDEIDQLLEEFGVQILSENPLKIGFVDDPDSIATGHMAELILYDLLFDPDEDWDDWEDEIDDNDDDDDDEEDEWGKEWTPEDDKE